jgi:hypothetical protein
MDHFYRFRSLDNLLGKHAELENQEIFFASQRQLNDPMEGFIDLYWQGDEIVWKNLIRHYLLCLNLTFVLTVISGSPESSQEAEQFELPIHASESALPTEVAKDSFRKICQDFFSDKDALQIPKLLSSLKRRMRREELTYWLQGIHGAAVSCIVKFYQTAGRLPTPTAGQKTIPAPSAKSAVDILRMMHLQENNNHIDHENATDTIHAGLRVFRQIEILSYANASGSGMRLWQKLCFGFPEAYVSALRGLVYVDWFAACFVSSPHHAAMWGNYADGHRGVCLKFHASRPNDPSSPYLKLRRVVGWSANSSGTSKIYNEVNHRFFKIDYKKRFQQVDFFRSMGNSREAALKAEWFVDDAGAISKCADELFSNPEGWREKYWKSFEGTFANKLEDWKHEDEYRLVLYSALNAFSDPADRKLRYNFQDLAGIVFGINTTLEDRAKIVNIISEKCNFMNRSSFEFHQAYYSPSSGRVETEKLDLLKTQ